MRDVVSKWLQEGSLWVWRYQKPRQNYRGWHFSADPLGCRSITNLLEYMSGGEKCHRTLNLSKVTEDVLAVPNFDSKVMSVPEKIRIAFSPDAADLLLCAESDRLTLTVGNSHMQSLWAVFISMGVGGGDFGISTSNDSRADPWTFWWPPKSYRINT